MSNKWYESDNPSTVTRGATWRGMVWVLALIVFIALIGVGFWVFSVVTAPVKGQGDAFKTQQSGTNRISAQERFEDLHAEILSADRRLDSLRDAVKADPKSNVARTTYTGAVNYCIDVVADYNAEARKYTSADFRSADLPYQIDNLSTDTDCKPTEKRSTP